MNLIFKKLSDLIKNCKCLNEEKELIEFEEEIEKLIQENIKKYPDYLKKYRKINQKQLNSYSIKTIINEVFPPINEIYPEINYPFLKYFTYTKYRTKSDLFKALESTGDYSIKHPLLYNYLNNSEEVKKLKYFPSFNELTNYLFNKYSYQISRDDANIRTL